ncbi:hypothetical protein LZ32DRAFT_622904 [Colletotrichum eremochloae]|nr:hypothetical protein LZ32DRAFT_622904 [Colletotrichum eremochloae]
MAPPGSFGPRRPLGGSLEEQRRRYEENLSKLTPIQDRASIAKKSKDQRDRIWDRWLLFTTTIAHVDPEETWIDLCRRVETATKTCQSFLRWYTEESIEQRVCLGNEEYEWKRTVNSAVTIMEVWKCLLAHADANVLQKKRSEDIANESTWTLAFRDGKRRATGPVYPISIWIRETLVNELGLSREQTFEKMSTTAEDITRQLDTLWRRAIDIRCSPSVRVAFHAILLLSSIGGFRPGTLMNITYKQIGLAVVRDPVTNRTHLVVTVRVVQNKQATNKIGKTQDHLVNISITQVPWPLLCFANLVVIAALANDAFDVHFSSLEDILSRPQLGNVQFVRLGWKESVLDDPVFNMNYHMFYWIWYRVLLVMGVRNPPRPYSTRVGAGGRLYKALQSHLSNHILDHGSDVHQASYQPVQVSENLPRIAFSKVTELEDHTSLYALLENSTLQMDEKAPIYPSIEDVNSWEERNDIVLLRKEYESMRKNLSSNHPEAKRIAARINSIRDDLEYLTVERDREQYFKAADRLRAAGHCIPEDLSPKRCSPRKNYHATTSEAAAAIGKFLRQRNHTLEQSPSQFTDMGLLFLRQVPESVKTLAARYVSPEIECPSAAKIDPTDSTDDKLEDLEDDNEKGSKCLFGCGKFANRRVLTRHTRNIHRDKRRNFDQPFNCPECERMNQTGCTIDGMSAWSNHVERFHGALHTPYAETSGFKPLKVRRKRPRAKKTETRISERARHPPVPKKKRISDSEKTPCLRCGLRAAPGQGHSRHMNKCHIQMGHFDQAFACESCLKNNSNVMIQSFEHWIEHAESCHGRDGLTGHKIL